MWLFGLLALARADVRITEVLADPARDASCDGVVDTVADEFVEIVNIGAHNVALTDHQLHDAVAVRFSFPPLVLAPREAVVVFGGASTQLAGEPPAEDWCSAEPDVTFLSAGPLSLNNDGDTVRLAAPDGSIVDEMTYGSGNADRSWIRVPELIGSAFVAHDRVGGGPMSPGLSAELLPFAELTVGCTSASGAAVVINEFLPNPPGVDANAEWVELYNAGLHTADLSGWSLEAGTSAYETLAWLTAETQLEPAGFLRLGAEADGSGLDSLLGNASTNADALRLVDCEGRVSDTVVYGNDNADGWLDDMGQVAHSLAPNAWEGWSAARIPDGHDTDQSGADFVLSELPTPGQPNGGIGDTGSVCRPVWGTVLINELLVDPEGPDASFEFVELFNVAAEPVSLDGWSLVFSSDFETHKTQRLPSEILVGPRAHWVVGSPSVGESNTPLELTLGNGSGTDRLQLVDCLDRVVDSVLYGDGGNRDGLFDDRGVVVEPYVDPASGQAMQRRPDGHDRDLAEDWIVTHAPTPGRTNEVVAANEAPLPAGCGDASAESSPDPGCAFARPGAWHLWAVALFIRYRRRAPRVGRSSA